jgi:hypothetical protein
MTTLEQRLQEPPDHLTEFFHRAEEALTYLRDNATIAPAASGYSFYQITRGVKRIPSRPLRTALFIADPKQFLEEALPLADKLSQLIGSGDSSQGPIIDRVLYTTTMAHACAFESLLDENAGRRSTGVIFSALMRALLRAGGTDTQALSFAMGTDAGVYHYQVDGVANRNHIESSPSSISSADLLISCMTTTKDRLTRIFADKLLLERYYGGPVKLAVIALHDVQRKGAQGVTWTFLPKPFLLNWAHLAPLQGLYYLDVPQPALAPAFQGRIRPVHELVLSFPT